MISLRRFKNRRREHTSIVEVIAHLHTPGKVRVVVELLVCAVEETFGGNVDRTKSHVIEPGAYSWSAFLLMAMSCSVNDGVRSLPVWYPLT